MRKHLTLIACICLASISVSAQSGELDTPESIVIQFDSGDANAILQTYDLFKGDENVQVINSCEILNQVVLSSQPDKSLALPLALLYPCAPRFGHF